MKDFLKKLAIPLGTYVVLRGGEAIVSGVRTWRKNKRDGGGNNSDSTGDSK
jgi:hypothetical protein